MLMFKSDLKEYLLNIHDQKKKKDITEIVIKYLLEDNNTALGFYSLLEDYGIQNVQSLKKSLINLFIDIKNEIIASTHFLSNQHLQDLDILKKLFQINDTELLHYKTNEIQDIISNQIKYLIDLKNLDQADIKHNLSNLKQLLGIPISRTSNSINNNKQLQTLQQQLSL